MTYPTSYEALVGRAKLQAGAHTKPVLSMIILSTSHTGEWLLVLAAAGGVGMAAVQVGKGVPAAVAALPSLPVLDRSDPRRPRSARGTRDRLCVSIQAGCRTYDGRRGLCRRLHTRRLAERGFEDYWWAWG